MSIAASAILLRAYMAVSPAWFRLEAKATRGSRHPALRMERTV